MEVRFSSDKTAKILGWKIKEGAWIPLGHTIFSYSDSGVTVNSNNREVSNIVRFKSPEAGVVTQILAAKGTSIINGTPLYILDTSRPCSHPTVIRDLCAECGVDLQKLDDKILPTASVSMVHSVPDLRVSKEQAQILGKGDEQRLLKQRKLVLLVDLDQTLIHTTNDCVPINMHDVFHFQLWGHGSVWYHTRLRPHTRSFLEKISKYYELHICTFGTRSYAHRIAHELDPDKKYFFDRILSRDECFSQNSKTANLKELFPRGDHMVCIIDDREDVWNFAPNLIHVKPYHYFRHTGDINAPPGLSKMENDEKLGYDFGKDKVEDSIEKVKTEAQVTGEISKGEALKAENVEKVKTEVQVTDAVNKKETLEAENVEKVKTEVQVTDAVNKQGDSVADPLLYYL